MPVPDYHFYPSLPVPPSDRLCSIAPINICNRTATLSANSSGPPTFTSEPSPASIKTEPHSIPKPVAHERPHKEHAKRKKH